jgi:hypothetical protein
MAGYNLINFNMNLMTIINVLMTPGASAAVDLPSCA